MRAPRLNSLRRIPLALAAAVAAASVAGCPKTDPAPDLSGSTTGASKPAISARDAESLAMRDDLNALGASPQTPPSNRPTPAVEISSSTPEPSKEATKSTADSGTAAAQAEPVAATSEVAVDSAAESAATSAPSPAPGASWPNFRNGTDLRGIAGTTLPDQLELLWELETHDGVTSTAAIDSGRAYVAELSGNVRCLDLKSGQEYWHHRTIESQDPEEFAPGFNAPVTLSDKAVFIGDEEGTFHALDRATGLPLWKPLDTDGEIKGGASLLPPDPATGAPRVMFGSHDGKLYCLNADTGTKFWEFDTLGPVNGSQALTQSGGGEDGLNSTPAVANQFTFVAGCDKPFLRVVDVSSGQQHAEIPLESLMIASPALIGNVLYFGTPDGEVIALDWSTKQQQWLYADKQRTQEIHSSPAVTDKLVLIGSRDKRLHAIDRLTGAGAWTFETRGPIDSSPVVVGQRIYFGSADRHVYAIDFNGQEVWKHNAGHRISASPAVGEEHLVIGCEGAGGKVLCFGSKR